MDRNPSTWEIGLSRAHQFSFVVHARNLNKENSGELFSIETSDMRLNCQHFRSDVQCTICSEFNCTNLETNIIENDVLSIHTFDDAIVLATTDTEQIQLSTVEGIMPQRDTKLHNMREAWEISVQNQDFPWRFEAQWGISNQSQTKQAILDFAKSLLIEDEIEMEINNEYTQRLSLMSNLKAVEIVAQSHSQQATGAIPKTSKLNLQVTTDELQACSPDSLDCQAFAFAPVSRRMQQTTPECAFTDRTTITINQPSQACQISVDTVITGVTFSGENFVDGCTYDQCQYCPFVFNNWGTWINDFFSPIDHLQYNYGVCDAFMTVNFITVLPGISLTLDGVTFVKMRQQFNSLIKITGGGGLLLNNVIFNAVMATSNSDSSGVILVDRESDNSRPTIQWYGGTVQLVNHGYEAGVYFRNGFRLAPLFFAPALYQLVVSGVNFQYNLATNKPLISLNKFLTVEFSFCTFQLNIVTRLVELIAYDNQEWPWTKVDTQDGNEYYIQNNLTHVKFSQTNFINNGTKGSMILVYFVSGDIRNIQLESCGFEGNISEGPILQFLNQAKYLNPVKAEFESNSELPEPEVLAEVFELNPVFYNGDDCFVQTGTKCTIIYPVELNITGSTFRGNMTIKLIETQFLYRVTLADTTFDSNTHYIGPDFLTDHWAAIGLYINRYNATFNTPVDLIVVVSLLSISRCSVQNLLFTGNNVRGTSNAGTTTLLHTELYADMYESDTEMWVFDNLQFSSNVADSAEADVAYLDFGGIPMVKLTNISVFDQTSLGHQFATIVVTNNLTLEDAKFERNQFTRLVGVELQKNFDTLIMERVSFVDNVRQDLQQLQEYDSSLIGFIMVWDQTTLSSFNIKITDGTWKNDCDTCRCISVNELEDTNVFNITIQGNDFSDNTVYSIIDIEVHELTEDSSISSNIFQNNKLSSLGTVRFNNGGLLMAENTINQNETPAFSLIEFGMPNISKTNKSKVTLRKNTITFNTPGQKSIIFVNNPGPFIWEMDLEENKVNNNNGIVFELQYTHVTDFQTDCQSNKASVLSPCFYLFYSSMTSDSSKFERNTGVDGGAMYTQNSVFNAQSCTFTSNEASNEGGALRDYAGRHSFTDCTFESNSAYRGAAIFTKSLSAEDSKIELNDVTITSNVGIAAGSLYIEDQSLSWTGGAMNSNTATESTPSIEIVRGKSVLLDSITFSGQDSPLGSYLNAKESVDIDIRSCTFHSQAQSTNNVGFYLELSTLSTSGLASRRLDGSKRQLQSANTVNYFYGASLVYSEGSDIVFNVFEIIDSTNTKPLFDVQSGSIMLSNSEITDWKFSLIRAVYAEVKLHFMEISDGQLTEEFSAIDCIMCGQIDIQITNFEKITGGTGVINSQTYNANSIVEHQISRTTFTDCTSSTSGAAFKIFNGAVNIFESTFTNNLASRFGGAISAEDSIVTIHKSTFENNNSTDDGGAIYGDESSVYITNSTFTENISATGNGGAVQLVCLEDCEISILHNNFTRNQANFGGGAVGWESKNFPDQLFDANTFIENQARYNPDVASVPAYILPHEDDMRLVKLYQTQTADQSFLGMKPGGTIVMVWGHYDVYGKIVETVSNTLCQVRVLSGNFTALSGHEVLSNTGICNFTDFTLQGLPNTEVELEITSFAIDMAAEISGASQTTKFNIKLRQWVPGEVQQANVCLFCPAPSYSLNTNDAVWKDCPDEAVCYGGAWMHPKPGYWRHDKLDDHFYDCPSNEACLGSPDFWRNSSTLEEWIERESFNNEIEWTGLCEIGYSGNLCDTCDQNHYKLLTGNCEACDASQNPIVEAIFGIGCIIVFNVFMITILTMVSIREFKHSTYKLGIYFRILINHIQIFMVMNRFENGWPWYLREYMYLYTICDPYNGSAVVSCVLQDAQSEDLYYLSLAFYTVMPFIILILVSGCYFLTACIGNKWKLIKTHYFTTLVVCVFLYFPILLFIFMSHFQCEQLENGNQYVWMNLDDRCWQGRHLEFSLYGVLPSIIVWLLAMPALIFYLLKKQQLLDEHDPRRIIFAWITNGYQTKHYAWEYVIMMRKACVVVCVVWLSHIGISESVLAIIAINYTFIMITSIKHPYATKRLNKLEQFHIASTLCTAIMLLVFSFYEFSSDNWNAYLCFAICLAAGLAFFLFWNWAFWTTVVHRFVRYMANERKFKCFEKCNSWISKKDNKATSPKATDANFKLVGSYESAEIELSPAPLVTPARERRQARDERTDTWKNVPVNNS